MIIGLNFKKISLLFLMVAVSIFVLVFCFSSAIKRADINLADAEKLNDQKNHIGADDMNQEILPTNNPNVFFVRSMAVPYKDPNPSDKLTKWLDDSGFNLVDEFLPIAIIESVPHVKLSSDYQSYDLQTLKAMGEAGDHKALFFYAMNVAMENAVDAIPAFEKTIVEAGLTASIHQIASAYDVLAEMEEEERVQLGSDGANYPISEFDLLNENKKQFYIWLLSGKLLRDPISLEILENVSFGEYTKGTQESLAGLARENILRLNGERRLMGMADLEVQALDSDILDFAMHRVND